MADDTQKTEGREVGLSISQREVWLDQCAWPGSIHLHIGGAVYLEGQLDLAVFRKSLEWLVQENEALRLVPSPDGTQRLLDRSSPNLEIIDCSALADARGHMADAWANDIKRPFALGNRPPWRFVLYRASAQLHGISLHYHHLVMDGWGTSLVLQRWTEIYRQLQAGETPVESKQSRYTDFIRDSREYLDSVAFQKDRVFWLDQIPKLPPPVAEALNDQTGHDNLPAAHLISGHIHRSVYNGIINFAAQRQSTAFTVFLAAMAIYFGRLSKQRDVIVGIPSLNRSGRKFKETMGMFVGVMAIPVHLTEGQRVDDLLSTVSATIRSALRHPRTPLSELGKALGSIQAGRDSLFDLLLSFERQDYKLAFGEAKLVGSRQNFAGLARYPCSVTVCEFNESEDVEVVLEASAAYFGHAEATLLHQRILGLVDGLTQQPDALVDELLLLPSAEAQFIANDLQPAAWCSASKQTFIALFESWVTKQPHAVAVASDLGSLTYAELDQLARHIAGRIRQLGFGRDQVIAFAIERSPIQLAAILGIAKAGAAFLPLDPDLPPARLTEILVQSQACAFLVRSSDVRRLGGLHSLTLAVEELAHEAPRDAPPGPQLVAPDLCDLAYVLFTSGSTGRPKGVALEHQALVTRMRWLGEHWGITPDDCAGQSTQITFDPSLIEWCLALTHGARVALPAPGRLLPESLASFAVKYGVTFMAFVPSTLSRFLDGLQSAEGLKLRVACSGGEVLAPDLVRRYHASTGAQLYNVYGPTEAAIFATAWLADSGLEQKTLPIGKAITDARIYVLGDRQDLLPLGVAGEIYIGGGGVARGYLHRPDLTAQVFLPDPFFPGQRMYRTGDRGRMTPDGSLHFYGRLDRQVKLRGYRIELAEIEAAMRNVPGVKQAATKLIERLGKQEIHGWIAGSNPPQATSALKSLRQKLPSYMVPTAITVLPALPESSTGKIDYHKLFPAESSLLAGGSGRNPENELERELLTMWQQALKKPFLTVEDNFFDAGGDSLAAIGVLAGVEKLIGRRVPMYLLSERPTVESLAASLGEGSSPSKLLVNLSSSALGNNAQYRSSAPLYLAASGHGDMMRFQTLARALGGIVEVRMLQPPTASTVSRTVDLANLYVEAIQTQGARTCYVAGFSVGGLAALETANRLSRLGCDVKGLLLIDTIYPSRLWGGTILWRFSGWLVKALHIQDLSMNGRRLGAMLSDQGLIGQVMAVSGYRAPKFEGPTHLIKSVALAKLFDRLLFLGWRMLLGSRLKEYSVKGLHGSMFETHNIEDLVNVFRDATTDSPTPTAHG